MKKTDLNELRKDPLLGRWVAVLSRSMPPSEYLLPPPDGRDETEDMALILSGILKKLRSLFRDIAFNYFIHTAPNRVPRKDHWHTLGEDFHWHLEIMPRFLNTSGFEWGSGLYVLTTSPEDASKYLREA